MAITGDITSNHHTGVSAMPVWMRSALECGAACPECKESVARLGTSVLAGDMLIETNRVVLSLGRGARSKLCVFEVSTWKAPNISEL